VNDHCGNNVESRGIYINILRSASTPTHIIRQVSICTRKYLLFHHPLPRSSHPPLVSNALFVNGSSFRLGCVLLEIALWQPLSEFTTSDDETPDEFRARLLGMTRRELPGLVGRIYSEVTRQCLEINGDEGQDQMQEKRLWRLIEELGKCVV
jgi:hypothetical protein